ncbi:hypothetical protein EW146_g8698 [Bondarzewia mesenterica]|uniref:Uncharacterized protein n=1 Tax=Bondarzewia mesenterica TaxID=1095465 RepID=A0A4S4LE60_9AGAM|nr:hypothetical protein EW146_g8698 [Bondarzewia mesenterica]
MYLVLDESIANVAKDDQIEAINAFLVGIDGDEDELEELEDATQIASKGIKWAMDAKAVKRIELRSVDDMCKCMD